MKKRITFIMIIMIFSLIFNVKAEWVIDDRWEIDPRWEIGEGDYTLAVDSYPTNITFYINSSSRITPYSNLRLEAVYNITFTTSITIEGLIWTFWYWEDNTTNTNNERIISLDEDISLRAIYTTTGKAQLGEGVFTSGMDLAFIRDDFHFRHAGTTPYGQLLLDVSPYENHGYIYPRTDPYSSAETILGRMGTALEFDGIEDFINVTHSDSLNLTEAITISVWIYPYNVTGLRKIITKPDTWTLGINNGYLSVEMTMSDYTTYENESITSTPININTWYYLAVTYSYTDGYITVYSNGVEQLKIATNGKQIYTTSNDIFIGSFNGNVEFWDGVIDEVRIYSYSLTRQHIQTDMVTPIRVFKESNFIQTYDEDNGWTEGIQENYTGFTTEDIGLPYAQSNSTYEDVTIESINYLVGFSKYRYYCTLKFNSTYNAWNQHDFYWQFELFKNGILQTAYIMKAQIIREAGGNYTASRFWFSHYVDGSWIEDLFEYLYFDNEIPEEEGVRIIVDAWIGSDSKHFTMRMALENSTDGEEYYLQYSFPLTDIEGNPKHISWFDGWTVFTLGINNRSYDVWSVPSVAEISEHGIAIIIIVALVWIVVTGALIYQYKVRPYLQENFGFPLPPIPFLPETTGDFAHQLVGAFSSALQPVVDAFRPLTDAVLGVGRFIVQAFIDFAGQVSIALIDGFDALGLYVFGIDGMFSGFVNGASLWLGQIGILAGHMAGYIIGFIGFAVNIGSGIGQTIAGFFSLIAYSLSNSTADIVGQISSLFVYLEQFWNGTGVFTGAIPFSQLWLLFTIAFLCFIGIGIEAFGFGWFLNGVEKFAMIWNFIKGIIMFGFNLLQKIIAFIRSLIPL